MKSIIGKLNDGGPLITVTILIVTLIIIALIIRTALKKVDNRKCISLIASFGWFALAWGYLGRSFGLIMSFDAIAAAGEITPKVMAGGLKMALIGPVMGLSAFAIARIAIIIFTLIAKKEKVYLEK